MIAGLVSLASASTLVSAQTATRSSAVSLIIRTDEGTHRVRNPEGKNYRWGPVAGSAAVPSLVDENGLFFPSSEALYQHNPPIAEIERVLTYRDVITREGLQSMRRPVE